MAEKRKIEGKVTKKEHGLRKRKLDPRKEKEKVKLLSAVLAEVGAVQAELMEKMDTNPNLEDLPLIRYQLRAVNSQGALLDAMIRNSIDGMLAVLVADVNQGKGKGKGKGKGNG